MNRSTSVQQLSSQKALRFNILDTQLESQCETSVQKPANKSFMSSYLRGSMYMREKYKFADYGFEPDADSDLMFCQSGTFKEHKH